MKDSTKASLLWVVVGICGAIICTASIASMVNGKKSIVLATWEETDAPTPAARVEAMARDASVSRDATQVVAAIDRLTAAMQQLTSEVGDLRREIRNR